MAHVATRTSKTAARPSNTTRNWKPSGTPGYHLPWENGCLSKPKSAALPTFPLHDAWGEPGNCHGVFSRKRALSVSSARAVSLEALELALRPLQFFKEGWGFRGNQLEDNPFLGAGAL